MTEKNENYPVLPHIAYGLCEDVKGLYILLPLPPISLNQYRQMHHGAIKKEKEHCKAIIDVILISCINGGFIRDFTKDGLFLTKPVIDKCEATWHLSFLNQSEKRDTDNYVQKIFMDALVWSGVLADDNETIVTKTSVEFAYKKVNSCCLFLQGDVHEHMFLKSMPRIKYRKLMDYLSY